MQLLTVRTMRAGLLGAALLLAGSACGLAQDAGPALDPARLAAAKELIAAQGGVEQGRQGLAATTEAMIAQVRRANPTAADDFGRFMHTYMDPQGPRVSKFLDDVVGDMTRFYASQASVDDLRAMTVFVKTPAGQAMQRLAPQVGAIMAPRFMAFQEQLKKDIGEAARNGVLGKKQP